MLPQVGNQNRRVVHQNRHHLTVSGNGTNRTQGILYVVATPIGNLADLTFRALEVLRQVDCIACEDTGHTLKLLNHYSIQKPLLSVFGPKEKKETEKVLYFLSQSKSVALLSDAGTPAISDPGNYIVKRVREEGYRIEPIPGPSAVTSALSVSGCAGNGFIFLGFLHRSRGKIKKEFLRFRDQEIPIVFFESPYRILKSLQIASDVFGKSIFCWIGRELTKKFEEVITGSIEEVLVRMGSRQLLGEFTVILHLRKDPS